MNIKVVGLLLGAASLAVLFVAGDAAAQGRRGGQGPANYNAAAEITVKGTVEDLKPGPQQGIHVMLKTADATLELALGPSSYQTEKSTTSRRAIRSMSLVRRARSPVAT